MMTTFTLLALAGGALRVALNYAVRRKLGVAIGLPPLLALAVLLLAVLSEFISPFSLQLPFGLMLGLLLPDLLFRRAW